MNQLPKKVVQNNVNDTICNTALFKNELMFKGCIYLIYFKIHLTYIIRRLFIAFLFELYFETDIKIAVQIISGMGEFSRWSVWCNQTTVTGEPCRELLRSYWCRTALVCRSSNSCNQWRFEPFQKTLYELSYVYILNIIIVVFGFSWLIKLTVLLFWKK